MKRVVSLVFAAGVLCSMSALAAGPYEDHRLIRVWPDSPAERQTVDDMHLLLMSEAELLDGGTMYLATADDLAALNKAGVGYDVLVKNMQAQVDAERARLDTREIWGQGPAPRDDTFFTEFRDITELNTFWDQLIAAHPGLISKAPIGSSIEGRGINVYTIGGSGDVDSRPSIIFTGTAHAREWIGPMTVSYIMRNLVDGYGVDSRVTALLDNVTFRVSPMSNPDGYVYTWGPDRYWRKTRRNNGNGTYGVDWNRNFAIGWGGTGSSGNTSDETYRGTAPFSEPETQAIRDYTLSVPNAAFHIDYHSYSQLVLWPWGYTSAQIPEPDHTIEMNIGLAYAADMVAAGGVQYTPEQSSDLYLAGGDATDWHYGGAGVFSLTVELRPGENDFDGFNPSPTLILPTAQENYAAVLSLGETVAAGVSVAFPDGQPAVVAPNQPNDVSIEILPAFSGDLDPGTATLWSRIGASGPFTSAPMSASGNVYTGSLPAAPCGSVIEYYAQIDSTGGVTYTIPVGAPASSVYTADVLESNVTANDDMETDTGWTAGVAGDTATTGMWERADPQGTAAQPENDHTPGGTMCWVTGALAGSSVGTYDIDNGVTTLISPVLDASGAGDAYVSFWLWYSNDQGSAPGSDSMPIRVSNDGGSTWSLLDTISASTNAWVYKRYALASPTDQMRFRFEASDLGDGSIVEAALDDLQIELVGCTGNPADIAPPFGVLDLADVQAFINAFINGDPLADIAPPFGVLDLQDVQLFIASFLAGP